MNSPAPSNHRPNFRRRLLSLALASSLLTPLASAERSTVYDGSADQTIEYSYHQRFNESVAMTIEAWVFRDDNSRCETIASTNFREGFWFGFCPRLRFYRSGGSFADATVEIPSQRWVHVAASYDGQMVRFFVNGEAAGESVLSNQGAGPENDLMIGGDPGGFPFKGKIDELRIWNRAHSSCEIKAGLFAEYRSVPGLRLAMPKGGLEEVIAGLQGQTKAVNTIVSSEGVLPQRLPNRPAGAHFQIRAGEYTANGDYIVTYDHDKQFNAQVDMTLEAWVYREDATRCETIVSNDFQQSFWFGFCPKLRFYRSGGVFADAEGEVPQGRWTHVAVTCQDVGKGEAEIRFYIDGKPAGTSTIRHQGPGPDLPLLIGGDPAGFNLEGKLDELRLWNRARTPIEVSADRCREVHQVNGLVLALPSASFGPDTVNGLTGRMTAPIEFPLLCPEGVLPSLKNPISIELRQDPIDPFLAGLPPRIVPPKADDIFMPPPNAKEWEIIVKFRDDFQARALPDGGLSLNAQQAPAPLLALINDHNLRFMSGLAVPIKNLDELELRAARNTQRQQADLNGILQVLGTSTDPGEIEELAKALHQLASVEYADIIAREGHAGLPADIAPTTPDYTGTQTWQRSDPGVDIDYAELHNARGQTIAVHDMEWAYEPLHEDLVDSVIINRSSAPFPTNPAGQDHGTSVLGVLVGTDNDYGVRGGAPEATARFYSGIFGRNIPQAVAAAVAEANAGDVVLLEIAWACPVTVPCVALETNRTVFTTLQTATAAGVIVVEPAGNGGQNLDDATPGYVTWRTWGDSGAIMVGAGTPDANHNRANFSTFGSRVDVHAWGGSVSTTGGGNPFPVTGSPPNWQEYRTTFNGTSSAGAIVASACTALQSLAKAHLGRVLTPAEMRSLLKNTGTPQGAALPGNIGPHINLRNAIDQLIPIQVQRPVNGTYCFTDRNGLTPDKGWVVLSEPEDARVRQFTRGAFTMDHERATTATPLLNMVTLHLDLSSLPNAELRFTSERGDLETLQPIPESYEGWVDGDGVSFSGDGITWHRIDDLGTSRSKVFDLSALAAAAGVPLNDNFRIRFQQFGNVRAEDGAGITISGIKVLAHRMWVRRTELTVSEGRSFDFIIQRNFSQGVGFVRYSVVYESASSADLVSVGDGVVVFQNGETVASERIATFDDSHREPNETLRVVVGSDLSHLFWAGRRESRVTILDNDAFAHRRIDPNNHQRIPIPGFPNDCRPGPADEPCWPWPFPGPRPIPGSPIPPVFEDFHVRVEGLSHPRPRDLLLWVQAPNGNATILMAGVGGEEPVEGVNLVFSTQGAPLGLEEGIQSGIVSPSIHPNVELPIPPGGSLLDLIANAPRKNQGNWELHVYDLSGESEEASIETWALEFLVETAPKMQIHLLDKDKVQVSWEAAQSEGWKLHQSGNLRDPWTEVNGEPVLSEDGQWWTMLVEQDKSESFFRLERTVR